MTRGVPYALFVLLLLEIVLAPLRAVAATVTMLIYDGATRPIATTVLERDTRVRPETEQAWVISYDNGRIGYDEPASPHVRGANDAVRACNDAAVKLADGVRLSKS